MIKDTVVVDIDGCLNHYPDPLKMWAEMMLNLDSTESDQAIKKDNDFDLLKKTYRHSKILNYLLPREGSGEALKNIKNRGFLVNVLTSRNINKNPEIKSITENWLKKYKIPFDSIVFTKDKITYVKQHENKIIMVVEDDPGFLNSFEKLKTEVVAFKNNLNGGICLPHFHVVSSWKEIDNLFDNFVKKENF